MRMLTAAERAERDRELAEQERAEREQRRPEKPMTPSERYAQLAQFQGNHRLGLSDPIGRATTDMAQSQSRATTADGPAWLTSEKSDDNIETTRGLPTLR